MGSCGGVSEEDGRSDADDGGKKDGASPPADSDDR